MKHKLKNAAKQMTDPKFILLLIGWAFIFAMLYSCSSSKNYQSSPCWKGQEPRHRTSKMRA